MRSKLTIWRKSIAFLALIFAISLTAVAVAWHQGMRVTSTTAPPPILQLSIFGPAIAAIICVIAFERGQRLRALGLRMIPNWWWLLAFLVPVMLGIVYVLVTLLANGQSPFSLEAWAASSAGLTDNPMARRFSNIGVAIIGFSIVSTLTEELGWRGYLYYLWRPAGFLKSALAIGFVQGIWHWPLILFSLLTLSGNIPFDLAWYPIFTIVLGVYSALFRDQGRSVWGAGLFHGTVNAFAAGATGAGSYAVIIVLVLGAIAIAYCYRGTGSDPAALTPS